MNAPLCDVEVLVDERSGKPLKFEANASEHRNTSVVSKRESVWRTLWTALISSLALFFALRYGYLPHSLIIPNVQPHRDFARVVGCQVALPNLFSLQQCPITGKNPLIAHALADLQAYLSDTFHRDAQLDALSFGVVTADGPILEVFEGVLRANETNPETGARGVGEVDRHSIFRLASGSKFFVMLELLVLREKGALNLDDPITKFIPKFDYVEGGFVPSPSSDHQRRSTKAPITIRQLATHMAGLTREFPRANMSLWPHSLLYAGPPGINGMPFPRSLDDLLFGMKSEGGDNVDGLDTYPLVVPQWTYPVYSNVGWALLGQVAVKANAIWEGEESREVPKTWTDLAARDVFIPLGMNGSAFTVTSEQMRQHVAVARLNSSEVDMDFLDVMSASGGQHSSLADYTAVLKSLLNPSDSNSKALLPPHVLREWSHALYHWPDEISEVGMVWEIDVLRGQNGRPVRVHSKHGSLLATKSALSLIFESSYGIAGFTTGSSPALPALVRRAFEILQPAVDAVLEERVRSLYEGVWMAESTTNHTDGGERDGESEIVIRVRHGQMVVEKLLLRGSDVLALTQGISSPDEERPSPIMMWSTGRLQEFRLVFGGTVDGASTYTGCLNSWATIDEGFSRGYGIDLAYFVERSPAGKDVHGGTGVARDSDGGYLDVELEMHIPGAGVMLRRR